jgi:hypothetical protein
MILANNCSTKLGTLICSAHARTVRPTGADRPDRGPSGLRAGPFALNLVLNSWVSPSSAWAGGTHSGTPLHSAPSELAVRAGWVGGWVTTDATTTPEGDKRGYARAEPEPGPGALGNGTVHTTPQCGRLGEAAAAQHSMHVSGGGRPRPIASVPVQASSRRTEPGGRRGSIAAD